MQLRTVKHLQFYTLKTGYCPTTSLFKIMQSLLGQDNRSSYHLATMMLLHNTLLINLPKIESEIALYSHLGLFSVYGL